MYFALVSFLNMLVQWQGICFFGAQFLHPPRKERSDKRNPGKLTTLSNRTKVKEKAENIERLMKLRMLERLELILYNY